jgi:hypothetical protein
MLNLVDIARRIGETQARMMNEMGAGTAPFLVDRDTFYEQMLDLEFLKRERPTTTLDHLSYPNAAARIASQEKGRTSHQVFYTEGAKGNIMSLVDVGSFRVRCTHHDRVRFARYDALPSRISCETFV